MSGQALYRVARWVSVTASLLAVTLATAGESAECGRCTLSLESLTRRSWPELEALFRQADAGQIPTGYARGRAIYCPEARLSGVRSGVSRAVWHGKVFSPCEGSLVNQWSGFRAIHARVEYGPSWLDGRPAIVMDYSGTSRVWAQVRDEVREVSPGLYLGRMYRRATPCPEFKLFFALEAEAKGCGNAGETQ